MTEANMTEDEVRTLVRRFIDPGREFEMYPFEFGWLVQESTPQRTPGTMPSGSEVGLASLIVDSTGVVTVQTSLPLPLVMAQYSAARREGRIIGHQVWPEERDPDDPR